MRRIGFLIVALILLGAYPTGSAAKFHYTHRVTATATLVDNWTVNDPNSCGPQGGGTVTLSVQTQSSTRIRPMINKSFAEHEGNGGHGNWLLGVPAGSGIGPMGPRKTNTKITTVDNTVPGPPKYEEFPCDPIDKSACGTKAVKGTRLTVAGYNPRNLYGTVFVSGGFTYASGGCQRGALESWREPDQVTPGINKQGDMIIKMPSQRSVRRHKKTVVTGTDHRKTTSFNDSTGVTNTDDVTRTITVTIEKL